MSSEYVFTNNWAKPARVNWQHLVNRIPGKGPINVVEIGAFEGQTTFYVLDEFLSMRPGSTLRVIDPFEGSEEHSSREKNDLYKRFSYNKMVCEHTDMLTVMQQRSDMGLIELINRKATADIIYVDGDHNASTVLSDLTLSWLILKPGGVILCDDYNWNAFRELQKCPRVAIDSFIHCYWHMLKVVELPFSGQCAFIKK